VSWAKYNAEDSTLKGNPTAERYVLVESEMVKKR
jgi:hypothetical protein